MEIHLSSSALRRLERLKSALQADDSAIIEEAIERLYEAEIPEVRQAPATLAEVLDRANLLKGLYRCTRNALGQVTAESQPLILEANTEEEAWQKMAILFPTETSQGFTISGISLLEL